MNFMNSHHIYGSLFRSEIEITVFVISRNRDEGMGANSTTQNKAFDFLTRFLFLLLMIQQEVHEVDKENINSIPGNCTFIEDTVRALQQALQEHSLSLSVSELVNNKKVIFFWYHGKSTYNLLKKEVTFFFSFFFFKQGLHQ